MHTCRRDGLPVSALVLLGSLAFVRLMALPAFESLLPRAASAAGAGAGGGTVLPATTATGAPLRMAVVYIPNGVNQSNWWPKKEGKEFELAKMAEGCGLTISGFYYVCLRRSDGRIEGLYCDPQSSPYQHLMLERSKNESWWWGWEFK